MVQINEFWILGILTFEQKYGFTLQNLYNLIWKNDQRSYDNCEWEKGKMLRVIRTLTEHHAHILRFIDIQKCLNVVMHKCLSQSVYHKHESEQRKFAGKNGTEAKKTLFWTQNINREIYKKIRNRYMLDESVYLLLKFLKNWLFDYR